MMNPFHLLDWISRSRFWWAGFKQRKVKVQDFHEHAYWEGGKGEPLVLVHGLGGSTFQDFKGIAELLVKKFHVISLDLPGFGYARDIPFQQSISNQSLFLRKFLDSIGLESFHLMGNSMGGWISLKFTHENPDRVRKLVLTCPAGIRFDHPPLEVFLPSNEAGLIQLLSYIMHHPPKPPKWFLKEWLQVSLKGQPMIQQMIDSMLTGQDLMEDHLPHIKHPTLILWGAQDRLIPAHTGYRMASMLPNARLEVIDDCGHLLFHEKLRRANQHLEKWL
jgi:pimeloyl-ACP methyl ester carboxylesterase